MSVNSSFSNGSLLPPQLTSINSNLSFDLVCFITRPYSIFLTTFFITNIFLFLPLCSFILYHGLQKWQKKRSTSSATISHSDCFTYHMAAIELIGVLSCVSYCGGIYVEDLRVFVFASSSVMTFVWHGQTFFHLLTCLERYVAVVHPITYLRSRNKRGVRTRNISIACILMLSCVCVGLEKIQTILIYVDLCLLMVILAAVSFFSFTALRVLIRPGPGKQSGSGVDHSKQRAFHTFVAILVALIVRFVGALVWLIVDVSRDNTHCLMVTCGVWFNLPSSLVLPVLFLHRAEKLVWCQKNKQCVQAQDLERKQ